MEEEYLFPFFFSLGKVVGALAVFCVGGIDGRWVGKKRSKGEKNITTVHRETRREDAKEESDAKRAQKFVRQANAQRSHHNH